MIDNLYPRFRDKLTLFLRDAQEIDAFLYSDYRSLEEQNKLFEQGRSRPGPIITNANGGFSYHNYGLAADLAFKDRKNEWTWDSNNWDKLGELGKKYNLEWGGNWKGFKDYPHFQMSFGITISELFGLYSKTWHLIDVWAELDKR